MKLTDKKDSLRERALIFGGPKSGKSLLVGELTKEFNLKYFDLENGYKTLRQLPQQQQDRIELYSIPDTKIWPVAIGTMLKVITGLSTTFCVEHGSTACLLCKKDGRPMESVELNALSGEDIVVIDSLTQLSLSTMSHIKKNDDELDKPTWDNYASQGFLLDKFLSQVQQAKFNICVITHEVESELENGGKKLVPVAGTREFSRNTAKYFDHVIYCELKNKKHAFGSATDYSMSVLTGSRVNVAIEKLSTASLLSFFRHEVPKASDTAGDTAKVLNTGSTAIVQGKETEASKTVAAEHGKSIEAAILLEPPSQKKLEEVIAVLHPKKDETIKEKLARLKAASAAEKEKTA